VHQLPNGANCGGYGSSAQVCADGPCVNGSMGTVCGYENGQGTCSGNPASMCISGVCGSDGACGLANGEPCSSDTACRTGACGLDGNCGLTPGAPCSPGSTFNACRTGACTNSNCGGYPNVSPSFGQPFTVASGQIFFTDQGGAIDACPVSGCTLANVAAVRAGAGTPASAGSGPTILGANAQSVFFSDPTGMYRCDLPSCTGAEVMLGPSVAMATNAAYGSQPPMLFTSKAFWVPVASTYAAGNISIGGPNANAYGWCSLSSCPGGAPATFTPDRAVDPREVGLGETYDTLPFAADDTSIYWASFALLGLPGSQVLSTPSPTP
jgi:hypothetical protein